MFDKIVMFDMIMQMWTRIMGMLGKVNDVNKKNYLLLNTSNMQNKYNKCESRWLTLKIR